MIKPGFIRFALIFSWACSIAKDLVKLFKAPFVDAYPESSLNPFSPTIEPMFTIEDLILLKVQKE